MSKKLSGRIFDELFVALNQTSKVSVRARSAKKSNGN